MNREQRRELNKRYEQEKRRVEKLYGGPKVCIICGKTFTGLGNNPWPLLPESTVEEVDRRCCTECDETKVTPARVELLRQGKFEGFEMISAEMVKWLEENYPGGVIKITRDQEN